MQILHFGPWYTSLQKHFPVLSHDLPSEPGGVHWHSKCKVIHINYFHLLLNFALSEIAANAYNKEVLKLVMYTVIMENAALNKVKPSLYFYYTFFLINAKAFINIPTKFSPLCFMIFQLVLIQIIFWKNLWTKIPNMFWSWPSEMHAGM